MGDVTEDAKESGVGLLGLKICAHGHAADEYRCVPCLRIALTDARAVRDQRWQEAKEAKAALYKTEADLAAALKREGEARADLANADALAKELQDEAREARERAIEECALATEDHIGNNVIIAALPARIRALAPAPTAEAK